jgi:hypothetical protein
MRPHFLERHLDAPTAGEEADDLLRSQRRIGALEIFVPMRPLHVVNNAINRSTSRAAASHAECPKISRDVPLEKMFSRRVPPPTLPQHHGQKNPCTKTSPQQNEPNSLPTTPLPHPPILRQSGNWQPTTGNYFPFARPPHSH